MKRAGRGRSSAGVSIEVDGIADRIHSFRGERVMLDEDLAALYGVPTKRLNEAVRRNPHRFPDDFMFRLTTEEVAILKSQSATSRLAHGGRRRSTPRAFTEEGVAMLSSILHSPRAIAVNILVMRAFVRLRRAQGLYADVRRQIEELVHRVRDHDELLSQILAALDALEQPPTTSSRPLGFRPPPTRSTQLARGRGRTTRI